MLTVEDPTVAVKCRTAIKVLFLSSNLCLSVKLDSLSCSFIKTLTFYKGHNFVLQLKIPYQHKKLHLEFNLDYTDTNIREIVIGV
jgi:hypothetical protein